MCIDIIHEVFPDAKVEWQRTARVAVPKMTVDDTMSGEEICTFPQRDMSDEYYGPGVTQLKEALQAHKDNLAFIKKT